MSPKYPRFTGRELIKRLSGNGFSVSRIRGSHHILKHQDGRTTIVPVHSGEQVGPGLLAKILRAAKLEIKDL